MSIDGDIRRRQKQGAQPSPVPPPSYMDGWPRKLRHRATLTSREADAWAKAQWWFPAVVWKGLTARFWYWILDRDELRGLESEMEDDDE